MDYQSHIDYMLARIEDTAYDEAVESVQKFTKWHQQGLITNRELLEELLKVSSNVLA